MWIQPMLISLFLTTLTIPGGVGPAESIQERAFSAQPVAVQTRLDSARRVVAGPDGNFYVLDGGNHRVMVFSPKWAFVRQIGEVGQGAGDFLDPHDFAIDKSGIIYVIDGLRRVQRFSPAGKFLDGFRYQEESLTIAVNGGGEILLSQPSKGSLVSVYTRNGIQTRSFGAVKPAGDLRYQITSNRVHLSVASNDDVYLSFDHLGLLQKYDAAGRLVWEEAIPGDRVERMRQLFWSDEVDKSKYGMVLKTKESGIPAFYLAFNIFFDQTRSRLYAPLNDGRIYVADQAGKPIRFMRQQSTRPNLYNSILVDQRGQMLLTNVWTGIYLVTASQSR